MRIIRSGGRAAAIFATGIASNGECSLVKEIARLVVILDLRAIVSMNARTTGVADIVFAQAIVVPNKIQVGLGAPQDLSAESRLAVWACIGLPAIDDPGLDLQFRGWEILYPQAVEKPRRVL